MKTILLVIAGISDTPEPLTNKPTPLYVASKPSLDILARRGELICFNVLPDPKYISNVNSLLALMGYDLQHGEPSVREMMEYGLDHSATINLFPTLRPYVIPGFSGHGVCITTSAWVRGLAKCALLRPLDLYSPGSSDSEILSTMAQCVTDAVEKEEFVFVYVDSPLKASLRGNYEEKVKAIEIIDRHLVTPIADYVWKSELLINFAVASDIVTPWHTAAPGLEFPPAVIYYNNEEKVDDGYKDFYEIDDIVADQIWHHPSDLIKYLCNFNGRNEEEDYEADLPF